MRQIRLLNTAELGEFARISANAYPGMKIDSEEALQRLARRYERFIDHPVIHLYGVFETAGKRAEKLVGVMRYHDYVMKLHLAELLVGGIGGIAVDLVHKKEKIARDMMLHFMHHYRDKGACIALLYPFRPDFYKNMGFGFGTKMNQYRIRPVQLPKGPTKDHISFLNEEHIPELLACYQRYRERANALLARYAPELEFLFASPTNKIIGFKQDGRIDGYLRFTFRALDDGNFLRHELIVREFVYENPAVLSELLTFLHDQADQVEIIEFNTQDENFHHLMGDPTNDSNHLIPSAWHETNTQGLGIMYRVIDLPRLFAQLADHDFGGGSCRLKLSLSDSFFDANGGAYVLDFDGGRATLVNDGPYDFDVQLDVAEFSSLIMGAVDFKTLYAYGLAAISDDKHVETANRLFHSIHRPFCLTDF